MTTTPITPAPTLLVCPPGPSVDTDRLDFAAARKHLTPEILISFRDEALENDDSDLVRLIDLVMSVDTADRLHASIADAVIIEMVAVAPADSDHPVVVAAMGRVDEATAERTANELAGPPVDSPTSRAFRSFTPELAVAFDELTPAQMALFAADCLRRIAVEPIAGDPEVAHALAHAQAGTDTLFDMLDEG